MKIIIEQLIQKASKIKTSQKSQHTDIRETLLGILDVLKDLAPQDIKSINKPLSNQAKAKVIIEEYQKQKQEQEQEEKE